MRRGSEETHGIPQRTLAVNNVRAKREPNNEKPEPRTRARSGMGARIRLRSESIRQKIIGPRLGAAISGFGGLGLAASGDSALTLFDEPTSEIGCGVFFEPLVKECGDLLAQIGGVGQAGKLVGLERIARGGEKEFPRGLNTDLRHVNLRRQEFQEYNFNIIRIVIYDSSVVGDTGLWKSVEKQEKSANCCSGCAGDYEDPDWSAWEADVEEEEGDALEGDGVGDRDSGGRR
jgi:hypothetical protein